MSSWKSFLFWVVLLGGTLGFAELLVRAALPPPALYPKPQETPVMTEHLLRGYSLLPGASGQYSAGGHSARIDINARGFRDGSYADALESDVRVLAVGDSFTLGLGVDSTDPWPEQIETLLRRDVTPRASVVNAGVPGYSARQMRQTVEEVILELHPKIVLFGMNGETYWRMEDPYVYWGGQLVRSSVLPRVTVGRRGLYYSRIEKWPWLHGLDLWLNRHFELGAHLLDVAQRVYGVLVVASPSRDGGGATGGVAVDTVRAAFAPVLAEIGRTNAVARAAGATLVVLLINPQEKDGSFRPAQRVYNQVVGEFCRAEGIRFVDLLPLLTATAKGHPVFRSPDDYHWNPDAHRLAAEQLYGYLSNEGLVTTSPRAPGG